MPVLTTAKISSELDPLAVSVTQAARSAGVSRARLYVEMRLGRLKFAKLGARRLILVDDLREWLNSLRQDR